MLLVNSRQILDQMKDDAVFYTRLGCFDFAFLKTEDFHEIYGQYFDADKYQKDQWRSKSFIRHLHAKSTPDGYIGVHEDTGNVNYNLIIGGILHGLFDVMPWTFYCIFKLRTLTMNPSMQQLKEYSK